MEHMKRYFDHLIPNSADYLFATAGIRPAKEVSMARTHERNRDLERFLEESCGCVEAPRSDPASIACDEAALMLSQPEAG